jgi:hypothetical protein
LQKKPILAGYLMNRRFKILSLFLILCYLTKGQAFLRPNEWKKFRRELFFHIGSSHFLGDLGGRDKQGTTFGPADLNLTQTRTSITVGARYKLEKNINVTANFSYLTVRGDDAITEEKARNNRNLNFRSNIFELSSRIEYGWQSTKRGTSRYGIRQTYGKLKNITHSIYGFLGVGVFFFNPEGRRADGSYVGLYALHTEGQGLPGGPSQYGRFQFSIPFGGYYKLTFNKIMSVGLEINYRKTFTDYIDDVGGVYYDKRALEEAYGAESAAMADPSLGIIPGATTPDTYGNPAKRGDSHKDAFFSVELTAAYIFKQQKKSARLRSKF